MNERIKELGRQAGYPDRLAYGTDLVMEKFAELIVKETMQVVANNIAWNGYLNAAEAVIEHFGGEE